jgi:hypothetical protein
MSTRLYYSHIYFLTEGRYPIHQLPTVLVEVNAAADAPLDVRSTLFRWEPLAARERNHWLYLTRYGAKGYYIAMAEDDVLADIAERRTEYVIVNLEDAGYSSPAMLAYFDSQPAFTKVYERSYSSQDRTVIFRVDFSKLRGARAPLRVTAYAYESLILRGGSKVELDRALERLNSNGWLVVDR